MSLYNIFKIALSAIHDAPAAALLASICVEEEYKI